MAIKIFKYLGVFLIIMGLSGCGKVTYIKPTNFNQNQVNIDSRSLQEIVKNMINNMLISPRVVKLTQYKTPVVWVANVYNETVSTVDNINLKNWIATNMLDSGDFSFIDLTKLPNTSLLITQKNLPEDQLLEQAHTAGANYVVYTKLDKLSQKEDKNNYGQGKYFSIIIKFINVNNGIALWQQSQQFRTKDIKTLSRR